MKSIIGYRRTSTQRQSLSMDVQQSALQAYSDQTGCPILKTYTEVETGKRSDRPELLKALAHAKRAKAQLVVAKLDRLARNVAFVSALMRSDVSFCCADNPHANNLTLHVLAAVSEAEAKAIGDRTKAALQAAKRRGVLLGAKPGTCPIPADARKRGAKRAGETVARLADEAYEDLKFIVELRHNGMSQKEIAERLNSDGHSCRRGGRWTQGQVSKLLRRFGSR